VGAAGAPITNTLVAVLLLNISSVAEQVDTTHLLTRTETINVVPSSSEGKKSSDRTGKYEHSRVTIDGNKQSAFKHGAESVWTPALTLLQPNWEDGM
jgi:hypothetical protein